MKLSDPPLTPEEIENFRKFCEEVQRHFDLTMKHQETIVQIITNAISEKITKKESDKRFQQMKLSVKKSAEKIRKMQKMLPEIIRCQLASIF